MEKLLRVLCFDPESHVVGLSILMSQSAAAIVLPGLAGGKIPSMTTLQILLCCESLRLSESSPMLDFLAAMQEIGNTCEDSDC